MKRSIGLLGLIGLAACSSPVEPLPAFGDNLPQIYASTGTLTGCGSLFVTMMTQSAQVTMLSGSLAMAIKSGNTALAASLKKQLALASITLAQATSAYYQCAMYPDITGGGGGFACTNVWHPPVYNGAGVMVSEGWNEQVCK